MRGQALRRRPKLGQHFLVDPKVRARIIEHVGPQPEDCWLEIGPGHGEMTLELAPRVRQIVAVERDAALAGELRRNLAAYPGSAVIGADILKVSLVALAQQFGTRRWRVYGNLPYYITSPVLQRLFSELTAVTDAHVVVQREVAERLTASPGRREYGYLTVLTQFYTKPELLEPISRGAFHPPPKVESALVRLSPAGSSLSPPITEPEPFLAFLRACFRHKRKTLLNNLRGLWSLNLIEAGFATAGLTPRVRAEELSLDRLATLFRALRATSPFVVHSKSV